LHYNVHVNWTPVEADIQQFEFDSVNREHMARHDVEESDIRAVLEARPLFFMNMPGRTATHVMVGMDGRGRVLFIPMYETDDIGIWRPVTGWESREARAIYAEFEAGDDTTK
jgi:hypothetical protein